MVPPNGVSFARSGSTWIHWWSPVTSAKASMSAWVISCQSETPSSSPVACLSSSSPVMVRMAGTVCTHYVALLGGQRDGTHTWSPRRGGGAADQPLPGRSVRRRDGLRGPALVRSVRGRLSQREDDRDAAHGDRRRQSRAGLLAAGRA